ncbi:MAG: hypothetical protein ACK5ED_06990 [Gemmatimonadota bacterium]
MSPPVELVMTTASPAHKHIMHPVTHRTTMHYKIIIHPIQITQIRQHNRIQVNPRKTHTVILIIQILKYINLIKTQLMPTIPNCTPFHPDITVTPIRRQQQSLGIATSIPPRPTPALNPRIINRNP